MVVLLWSAKIRSAAKLPPFPGDIHGANHREPISMLLGNRSAVGVDGRWPEPWPGTAPECRVLTRSEAGLDCNAARIPW
jgi:hypothetical protein